MGADEENISRAFCRKRGLDPDTMVNVDGNGTMLPLWQVWTSDAALDAVSEAGKKAEWVEAVRAVCLDDVDEALREFAMDPTGDNGTKVAREFMRAFSAITPPRQENEGEPDSECKEADGCPTEGGVLKKFWREHQPDPKLCEFYQVKTWAELVAAQEEHIISLQGAAVRNVKPWEDTFPPTLLPKYLRDTGLAAAETKVKTVVVYGATPPESGGQGEAVAWLHEVTADDGEPDQALSFSRDSFPLEGVAGYRTVSVRPLYTHPPASGAVTEALQVARDYVASALNAERAAFLGHENCGDIKSIAADLALIDAALAQGGKP